MAIGWGMHHFGIRGLTHFVLGLPAVWAIYLLARAMTPAAPVEGEQRLPM